MTVFVTAVTEAVVAENTGESVWTNGTLSFFNFKGFMGEENDMMLAFGLPSQTICITVTIQSRLAFIHVRGSNIR